MLFMIMMRMGMMILVVRKGMRAIMKKGMRETMRLVIIIKIMILMTKLTIVTVGGGPHTDHLRVPAS